MCGSGYFFIYIFLLFFVEINYHKILIANYVMLSANSTMIFICSNNNYSEKWIYIWFPFVLFSSFFLKKETTRNENETSRLKAGDHLIAARNYKTKEAKAEKSPVPSAKWENKAEIAVRKYVTSSSSWKRQKFLVYAPPQLNKRKIENLWNKVHAPAYISKSIGRFASYIFFPRSICVGSYFFFLKYLKA